MKEKLETLKSYLDQNGIEYGADVGLSEYSYFKRGSVVKVLVHAQTRENLQICARYLTQNDIPYKVIGATSNLLFLDGLDYDVFVSVRKMTEFSVNGDESIATVGAGLSLSEFVLRLADLSAKGFEGLEAIPGTVGGAVYMNAGAFRYEIKDNLIDVDFVTPSGDFETRKRKELDFSFRHSKLQDANMGTVISARFKIEKGNQAEIKRKIAEFSEFRRTFLEQTHPNLGSVFATYNIYKDIARNHKFYGFCITTLKFMFYRFRRIHKPSDNRILNRCRNRPTDNRILNSFTAWYFGWKFACQPHSDKTLNCIINNGCTTDELLAYIKCLHDLTGGALKIENEILGENDYFPIG